MTMNWGELEAAAPAIAERGKACLDRVGLALLGTLRADGWPRIGPVEPHVVGGQLLIGVIARSLKARDLARDPRCTLQSVVSHPDSGEPELKLYCSAAATSGAPPGAWWTRRPAGEAHVFELRIAQAALVEWDVERSEMTVTSWSPSGNLRTATRRIRDAPRVSGTENPLCGGFLLWARLDSNQGPTDYESAALTS
jgi:hypothetical protein